MKTDKIIYWEYFFDRKEQMMHGETVKYLKMMGDLGWELCSVCEIGEFVRTFYFKRPKVE